MSSPSTTLNQKKVHLISLGCARNRVDSEVMLGSLLQEGWVISDQPEGADAVIVNTCGFIESAKEESIDVILDAAEQKKVNPHMALVVTGCLTQRYKKQLAQGLPEVDFFLGTDQFPKIAEYLGTMPEQGTVIAKRHDYLYGEKIPRLNTLTAHSAYIKVAEGCQHNCSFCIIPAIRGRLRSRSVSSVVEEVKNLVGQGIVEVNLIAQDLAAYGRDRNQDDLLPLLRALEEIDGLRWVRLLYVYPENLSDEMLEFIAQSSKIVKYLDIPMQHASDRILGLMKRQVTGQELRDRVARVRALVPGIFIRTTVMTGFPSESEEDFQELLQFIKDLRFDHLGCFAYSQEEGTVAARLEGQVDDKVKEKRRKAVMRLQQKISKDKLKSFVGETVDVVLESTQPVEKGLYRCRAFFQAPEVDGVTYVKVEDLSLLKGSILQAKVVESLEYDLIAEALAL